MVTITYKKMTADDIAEVVRIHKAAFKNYFLTSLGEKFLYIYYSQYLSKDYCFAVVARADNKPVGFIVGTNSTQKLYRNLYKDNFFKLSVLFLRALFTEKVVQTKVFSRYRQIITAIKSRFSRPPANPEGSATTELRLLSIAVLPQFRGNGISRELLAFFERNVKAGGIKKMGLSVLKNNPRAICFYQKTGWKEDGAGDESLLFVKDLRDRAAPIPKKRSGGPEALERLSTV